MSLAGAYEYAKAHPPLDTFLYEDMSKDKYDAISFLYSFPIARELIDWRLDVRASQEYMNRYGLSWNDVHDFRKLSSFGSQSRLVGSSYRMISKNVEDLYS